MNAESEIQNDVDSLRARFPETKALYREVCALLFFRHGITPTTTKLYNYVRKGSMNVPTAALATFWDELRSRAAVRIDHPGLPEDLRQLAGEAIQTLWVKATEATKEDLAALRLEAREEVTALESQLAQSKQDLERAQAAALRDQATQADLRQGLEEVGARLGAERLAHAAMTARLEATAQQRDDLRGQLERTRTDFADELGKTREAVAAADKRAAAAQRKALLEVEQERQAKGKSEKAADALRTELASVHAQARDTAIRHAGEVTQLRSDLQRLAQTLETTQAALANAVAERSTLKDQLDEQRQRAMQAGTEAATMRVLLAEFKSPPAKPKRPVRAPTTP